MSTDSRRVLLQLPYPELFEDEKNKDAQSLIGKFRYHADFEIALRQSASKGNAFVYKSIANHEPLRAFVFGRVRAIEALVAPREDVSIISPLMYMGS
jgi:hypothetical protein